MFCFFAFLLSKISLSLQKEEDIQNNKKALFYAIKTGPIMLRNMLGPTFNLYLDQFLFVFIVFSEKLQFKTTSKKEIKHYLWAHLC